MFIFLSQSWKRSFQMPVNECITIVNVMLTIQKNQRKGFTS